MAAQEKKWGVILRYIQMISNVVIKFVYTPFLLRALGQNEYGLFSLTMSIVGYLAILDLGFGSTVTRFTVKYRSEGDAKKLYQLYSTLSIIYILIGLLAMLICAGLSISAEGLFGRTMSDVEVGKLRLMILLCGVNLMFTFPLQIAGSVLVAYEKFIVKNGVTLLFTFVQPIVMVALLYLVNMKSVGAIVVVTACNLLTYFIYYIYAVRKLDFKFSLKMFEPQMIKGLLTFSVWMFLVMLFEQVQYNSGQFIIGLFQGADIVAIWGIAMIFILNYRSISTAITNVFVPSFMSLSFSDDNDGIERAVYRMTHVQSLALTFILANFILFGQVFIHLWAGGEYDSAYPCALIVMLSMTPALILEFCYLYQLASNQLLYKVVTSFVSYIVAFVIIYLMKGIDLQSYALVMAISLLVGQVVLVYVFVRKYMTISLWELTKLVIRVCWLPVLLSIVYYMVMRLWIPVEGFKMLLVHAIVFNMLLIISMWYVSLNPEDRKMILRR